MGSADQCQHDEADIHPRPCGRFLSRTPTSTASPTTTARPTSGRPRPRTLPATLEAPSQSPFPTAVSRRPPTSPTTPTASSPRWPTPERPSTLPPPLEDTPVRPTLPPPLATPPAGNKFCDFFWWQPSDADFLHKDNTVMMRFPRFVSNDDRKRLTMLVHKTTLNYLAIYYSLVIFLFP